MESTFCKAARLWTRQRGNWLQASSQLGRSHCVLLVIALIEPRIHEDSTQYSVSTIVHSNQTLHGTPCRCVPFNLMILGRSFAFLLTGFWHCENTLFLHP